jgi:hypothetical protein
VVAVASRRLLVLLLVLAALAVPAGALRAACAGRACAAQAGPARVPFCPLPAWLKGDISAGYRDGRSPDVLAVAKRSGLSQGRDGTPWPSVADGRGVTSVPIAFWGRGVDASANVPSGTPLDAIAPTIAQAIGLRRPHPDVRSGVAVPGVAHGDRPRLVVEIALTGIGKRDVEAHPSSWPALVRLVRTGAGTMSGRTGSLPLDPVAALTTIGTGGPPAEHGITGALIRNDAGRVVQAWGRGAPPSIISTLPDDLDELTNHQARIGLVAPSIADRGLVGGTWYPDARPDDVVIAGPGTGRDPVAAARSVLGHGYGADETPDVLGVVLDGRAPGADEQLRAIAALASRAARGSALVVVAGTGTTTAARGGVSAALAHVEDEVPGNAPVVAGTVPGGLFLDQRTLAREKISGQAVVDALLDAEDAGGGPLVRDAFQAFAVSFARYC